MLLRDVKPVKKIEDPYCKATENIPGDLGTDVGFTPFQTNSRLIRYQHNLVLLKRWLLQPVRL